MNWTQRDRLDAALAVFGSRKNEIGVVTMSARIEYAVQDADDLLAAIDASVCPKPSQDIIEDHADHGRLIGRIDDLESALRSSEERNRFLQANVEITDAELKESRKSVREVRDVLKRKIVPLPKDGVAFDVASALFSLRSELELAKRDAAEAQNQAEANEAVLRELDKMLPGSGSGLTLAGRVIQTIEEKKAWERKRIIDLIISEGDKFISSNPSRGTICLNETSLRAILEPRP